MANPSHKIALIGYTKVGKTNWVKHLRAILNNNEVVTNPTIPHLATLEVEVHPIHYQGHTFNVWDCAGDPKFGGLTHGYYVGASAFIVMYDCSDLLASVACALETCGYLLLHFPNRPVVLVGNKFGSFIPSSSTSPALSSLIESNNNNAMEIGSDDDTPTSIPTIISTQPSIDPSSVDVDDLPGIKIDIANQFNLLGPLDEIITLLNL